MIKPKIIEIERTTIEQKEISNIISCIQNDITEYIKEFEKQPTIILISKQLEVLLYQYMKFNSLYIAINEFNHLQTLFGIICTTSPVLNDFEFTIF